eukprot:MONOS_3862.1-p1 / transcript=MONOS_3862.1 / gene=MONOS_3862 / organism=Monocercomonoides_exilis_PA203 / gene_product=unspecified product / transcript_product=unspecified product / location=Mono_scaffold00095:41660-43050(-) / protein_length=426 / sequence_SO=supercontig / SO=protein_coding / is_pseudo=false
MLLSEAFEKRYGKFDKKDDKEADVKEHDRSTADLLGDEISDIKEEMAAKDSQHRLWEFTNTKCNGIEYLELNPEAIQMMKGESLSAFLNYVFETPSSVDTRHVRRMIPLEQTFHADKKSLETAIEKASRPIMSELFKDEGSVFTYRLEFKSRNNEEIDFDSTLSSLISVLNSIASSLLNSSDNNQKEAKDASSSTSTSVVASQTAKAVWAPQLIIPETITSAPSSSPFSSLQSESSVENPFVLANLNEDEVKSSEISDVPADFGAGWTPSLPSPEKTESSSSSPSDKTESDSSSSVPSEKPNNTASSRVKLNWSNPLYNFIVEVVNTVCGLTVVSHSEWIRSHKWSFDVAKKGKLSMETGSSSASSFSPKEELSTSEEKKEDLENEDVPHKRGRENEDENNESGEDNISQAISFPSKRIITDCDS